MKLKFPNPFRQSVPDPEAFALAHARAAAKDAKAAEKAAATEAHQTLVSVQGRIAGEVDDAFKGSLNQKAFTEGKPLLVSLRGGPVGKTGYDREYNAGEVGPVFAEIASWAKASGWNVSLSEEKTAGLKYATVTFTPAPEGPSGARHGARLPTPSDVQDRIRRDDARRQHAAEKAAKKTDHYFRLDQDTFWDDLRSSLRRGYDRLDFSIDTHVHDPQDILKPEAREELTRQGFTWRIDPKPYANWRFTLTVVPANAPPEVVSWS